MVFVLKFLNCSKRKALVELQCLYFIVLCMRVYPSNQQKLNEHYNILFNLYYSLSRSQISLPTRDLGTRFSTKRNRPRSMHQNSKMALRLSRQNCKSVKFPLVSQFPKDTWTQLKRAPPNIEVCPRNSEPCRA